MARKRMVTRTINNTKVTVSYADVATMTIKEKTFELNGTYRDNKAIFKAIKKYDSDEERLISVVRTEVVGTRYGMTEKEFLEHAQIIGADEETEDTDTEAVDSAE